MKCRKGFIPTAGLIDDDAMETLKLSMLCELGFHFCRALKCGRRS